MFINKVSWGSIEVDNKKYSQVIIYGSNIEEREEGLLREKFGTTHKILDEEIYKLLSDNPAIIIIGNGFDGALQVDKTFIKELESEGKELHILNTKEAVELFNKLRAKGKMVNALIHTTC